MWTQDILTTGLCRVVGFVLPSVFARGVRIKRLVEDGTVVKRRGEEVGDIDSVDLLAAICSPILSFKSNNIHWWKIGKISFGKVGNASFLILWNAMSKD
jgi:hypothetical protein